jgi:hypothetical protein
VENVISGTSQRPFEEKREENGEKKYEKYWKTFIFFPIFSNIFHIFFHHFLLFSPRMDVEMSLKNMKNIGKYWKKNKGGLFLYTT